MAKLSKRKIQERILKSKIKDLTNKDFAIETLSILKDNQSTSATVGLTLHLILWQIKENKVPKTTSFEQFVLTTLHGSHGGSYLMTLCCTLTSFSDLGNTVFLSEQRT